MKYPCLLLALIAHFCASDAAQKLESASLIGGKVADAREAKYLVSLQTDGEHFCGGGILNDWHVVSAAHCVFDDDNEFLEQPIKVVAGARDLNDDDDDDDEAHRVTVDVKTIYVPKKYNDSEWVVSLPRGDIAVLKLNESLNVRSNSKLKKLRLPRANGRRKYRSYEGEEAVIAGFGWDKVRVKHYSNATEYEVGSTSARLRSAKATVVANADCQKSYVDEIRDSELCARVAGHEDHTPQGVCRGDSGSPLVHEANTIIGVVSGIAVGCNENDQPGIYSRISSYVGFIRSALRGDKDRMRVKEY